MKKLIAFIVAVVPVPARPVRLAWLLPLGLATLLVGVGLPADETTAAEQRNGDILPGRYIVMVELGVDPVAVAAGHGVGAAHVYRSALNGFAGPIGPGALAALRDDPRVNSIVPDRYVTIADHKPRHAPGNGGSTGEKAPTGVSRIDAEAVPSSSVHIAILDTGIDLDHPDLNVSTAGFSSFGGSPNDGHGHGSHVAGTAAAKANTIGVRGVAPNAVLHAVKVLNDSGSGSTSEIVAGVEWVTANAASQGIKVANMSLVGCFALITCVPPPNNDTCGVDPASGSVNDPLHQAICASTKAAGVVYVAAAGNSHADANNYFPAAYPEVITVSAVADYNGKGGGGAAATCTSYGPDDSFATFSNYGAAVDIAAPGVCILSAHKDGTYKTLSGTSMAAPHVTGAVALAAFTVTAGDAMSPRNAAVAALAARGSGNCAYAADWHGHSAGSILYVGPDPDPAPECS